MAIKKAVAPKRSLKQISVASEVSLPPIVVATSLAKSKKTLGKKSMAKKGAVKRAGKMPEMIVVEEITLGQNESLKLPAEVSKEYVIVHRCTNCEHIPFSVTRLVTLFSILIMLLSVSVLIQVGTIDVSKLIAFVSPNAFAAESSHPAVRTMHPTTKTLYR